MRQRITILFLFLALQLQAQSLDFLAPRSVDDVLDADYSAYVDAVELAGAELSDEIKLAQNAFVIELKNDGQWNRMKWGYFFFAGNLAACKVNLKNPATYALTGTPVFDAGMGVRSNRYSSYLNQPFKSDEYVGLHTDLTVVQYIAEDNTEALAAFSHGMQTVGSTRAFGMQPYNTTLLGYKYHGTASIDATTTSNHRGLYVITYDGTNAVWYKDGVKDSDAATPDVATKSINRFILSVNTGATNGAATPTTYYDKAIALDFGFDRFNDADETAFRSNFTTNILPLIGQKRVENSAHCWFARNRAVYHSGSNKTFFSQVHGPSNANYSQYIFQLDNTTGIVTKFRLGSQTEKDDHNEPSIIIRASDSRLIAAYTEHQGATLRWRVSTNPLDISAWGAEQTFDPNASNIFTYESIFQVTNGDIYIFFRDAAISGGSTSRWSYVKSTNGGTSFSGYTTYSDFTYSNATQDPTNANIIHFIVSEHPGDGDSPNQIATFYFNAGTGTFHTTGGTNITANIPISAAHATIIQQNSLPIQCWIEDIIVDATGKPRVLFNLIPDEPTSLTKDEYYSEWNGSAWTTPYLLHRSATHYMETDLPSAPDYDSKWYAPLGAFDRGNPDRIFSSKEVSGVCEIHILTRLSASNFTSTQKTFNSGHDQWRPFTVAAPVNNVFWTDKIYYDDWLNLFKEDLRYATY